MPIPNVPTKLSRDNIDSIFNGVKYFLDNLTNLRYTSDKSQMSYVVDWYTDDKIVSTVFNYDNKDKLIGDLNFNKQYSDAINIILSDEADTNIVDFVYEVLTDVNKMTYIIKGLFADLIDEKSMDSMIDGICDTSHFYINTTSREIFKTALETAVELIVNTGSKLMFTNLFNEIVNINLTIHNIEELLTYADKYNYHIPTAKRNILVGGVIYDTI